MGVARVHSASPWHGRFACRTLIRFLRCSYLFFAQEKFGANTLSSCRKQSSCQRTSEGRRWRNRPLCPLRYPCYPGPAEKRTSRSKSPSPWMRQHRPSHCRFCSPHRYHCCPLAGRLRRIPQRARSIFSTQRQGWCSGSSHSRLLCHHRRKGQRLPKRAATRRALSPPWSTCRMAAVIQGSAHSQHLRLHQERPRQLAIRTTSRSGSFAASASSRESVGIAATRMRVAHAVQKGAGSDPARSLGQARACLRQHRLLARCPWPTPEARSRRRRLPRLSPRRRMRI